MLKFIFFGDILLPYVANNFGIKLNLIPSLHLCSPGQKINYIFS